MKNKNIITGILVLIGFFGLMWWGKSIQKPSSVVPGSVASSEVALVASEKLYDFGTISIGSGKVAKIFTVTNPTDRDVVLQSIVTSCMCTVAYIESEAGEKGPFGMPGHGGPVSKANEPIKSGESRKVRVVYDPAAHGPAGVGKIDRFIYLTDTTGGTLELEIKALVTP